MDFVEFRPLCQEAYFQMVRQRWTWCASRDSCHKWLCCDEFLFGGTRLSGPL